MFPSYVLNASLHATLMNETRHRVKLYSLNEKRVWDDKGTGHVIPQTIQSAGDTKDLILMVKSENDASVLLNSKILQDITYQKQQDTLIVWTNEEGSDVALSFQEKEGRDEIWTKICEVQGKDPDAILDDYEDDELETENGKDDHNKCNIEHLKQSDMFAEDELANNVDKTGLGGGGDVGVSPKRELAVGASAKKRPDTPRKSASAHNARAWKKQRKEETTPLDFPYENGVCNADPSPTYDADAHDADEDDDFMAALDAEADARISLCSSVTAASSSLTYDIPSSAAAFNSYIERSSAPSSSGKDYFYNATTLPNTSNPSLLPPCDLSHLPQIADVIAEHVSGFGGLGTGIAQANRRERLASALEAQAYVPQLLQLFRTCEDLEHTEGLHHMYQILKNLFLLNRNAVLELLVSDDAIVDVIGCLEYDPSVLSASNDLTSLTPMDVDQGAASVTQTSEISSSTALISATASSDNAALEISTNSDIESVVTSSDSSPKVGGGVRRRHREYVLKEAVFRQAVPITNPEVLRKIHQTYRLQYIQDVIFPQPSLFEENVLSSLTSFIFFNKLEIVNQIQEDEPLLKELFTRLVSEDSTIEQRRSLISFLKEFCTFSQTLQTQSRDTFLKTILNRGILSALENVLPSDDEVTRNAIVDIVWYLVEFSPSQIREYILKECENNADESTYFLNLLIEQMICDPDPELSNALQISLILRTIADPENMIASINKNEKTDFLSYFYKYNMHILTAPLFANTTCKEPTKDDYRTAHLLSVIVEILSFYVSHHTFHSKNYFINKDLLRRVLILTQSRHHFLVLCALRLMRQIVALKDEFYNRYIVRGHLFASVVEAFQANGDRYNLLNSAILELFDFIYTEDLKSLLVHVVENYYDKYFSEVTYVDTFRKLKTRYGQHIDSASNNNISTTSSFYYSSSTKLNVKGRVTSKNDRTPFISSLGPDEDRGGAGGNYPVDDGSHEEEGEGRKEELWFETEDDPDEKGNDQAEKRIELGSGLKDLESEINEGEPPSNMVTIGLKRLEGELEDRGIAKGVEKSSTPAPPTTSSLLSPIVNNSAFKNSFSTVTRDESSDAGFQAKKYLAPQISFSLQTKPKSDPSSDNNGLKSSTFTSSFTKIKSSTASKLTPAESSTSNKITLPSLVDYPDEDSEEEEENTSHRPSPV